MKERKVLFMLFILLFLSLNECKINKLNLHVLNKIKLNSNQKLFPSLNQNKQNKQQKQLKIKQLKQIKQVESDSLSSFLIEKLYLITPTTRIYLLLSLFCTFFQLLGLPAAQLFSLDYNKLYELWRPITSMTYFGPPSLYMANSIYFMIRYGQTLESEVGSANYLWFLITQTISLSVMGLLLGYRYQARSLLAAVVYACSQLHPTDKMRAHFGLLISSWQLPFLLMAIDCLSSKTILSALPHIMGIFSAFLTKKLMLLYPKLLSTPQSIKSFYYSKKKNSILNNYGNIFTSGAISPPVLPVLDFRKKKDDVDLDEIKRKKLGINLESKKGFRLGSKQELASEQ